MGAPDGSSMTGDAASTPDAGGGEDGGTTPSPRGGLALGDGTPGGATLTALYTPNLADRREGTDLAFDPATGKLWVALREYAPTEDCTPAFEASCLALQGSTLEITGADGDSPTFERKQDPNAWHFMRRPSSIAFGAPDDRDGATAGSTYFASCHEWRTGNFDDDPADFIGPTLWTTDPAVYPATGPGGNGSHLDMLHASPFCMGIAHDQANAYWVFNGNAGAIDHYDFHEPHVSGGADHSDGVILRYATGQVSRVPNVPSHLVYDAEGHTLYIADTGHGRIGRMDTDSGSMGERFAPAYDGLETENFVDGVTVEDVVPAGTLTAPSGLELHDGTLYVTDNATSIVYAFGLDGELLNQFDTSLPEGSLGGLTVGPDGKVYLVNLESSEVYRIDPTS